MGLSTVMRAIFLVFVVFAGAGTLLASWMRDGGPAPAQPELAVPKPALIRVSNGPIDGKQGLPDISNRTKIDAKSQPAALPLVSMSGKVEPPAKTIVVNAVQAPVVAEPVSATLTTQAVTEAPAVVEVTPPRPKLTVTCVAGCGDKNGQPVFQREVSPAEEAAAQSAEAVPVEPLQRSRRLR